MERRAWPDTAFTPLLPQLQSTCTSDVTIYCHLANLTGSAVVPSWAADLFIIQLWLLKKEAADFSRGHIQEGSPSPIFTLIVGFDAGTYNQLGSTSATVERKENCLGLDKKQLDVPAPMLTCTEIIKLINWTRALPGPQASGVRLWAHAWLIEDKCIQKVTVMVGAGVGSEFLTLFQGGRAQKCPPFLDSPVKMSILERPVSAQQTRTPVLMLNLTYQMALKSHSFRFSYPDKVAEG